MLLRLGMLRYRTNSRLLVSLTVAQINIRSPNFFVSTAVRLWQAAQAHDQRPWQLGSEQAGARHANARERLGAALRQPATVWAAKDGAAPAHNTPRNGNSRREAPMRLQRGLRPQQARDRAEQPHYSITEAARPRQSARDR